MLELLCDILEHAIDGINSYSHERMQLHYEAIKELIQEYEFGEDSWTTPNGMVMV